MDFTGWPVFCPHRHWVWRANGGLHYTNGRGRDAWPPRSGGKPVGGPPRPSVAAADQTRNGGLARSPARQCRPDTGTGFGGFRVDSVQNGPQIAVGRVELVDDRHHDRKRIAVKIELL